MNKGLSGQAPALTHISSSVRKQKKVFLLLSPYIANKSCMSLTYIIAVILHNFPHAVWINVSKDNGKTVVEQRFFKNGAMQLLEYQVC